MKTILFTLIASLLTCAAFAHGGDESRISIEPVSQSAYNAGIIHYQFQIFDDQTHKALTERDLKITNTKMMHFIAYDTSRNEFNHVHPAFDGRVWNVDLNLLVNGEYFFWVQSQLLDGTDFSVFAKAQVLNGKPMLPVTPLLDTRSASDGMTTLTLDNSNLKAGTQAMLTYKVSRLDGKAALITPYLGSIAHVIAVSPDADELIHVHPMAMNDPNSGMIHATFPTAGDYRIWVQLMDQGELKTIPLSVVVAN